MIRHLKRPNIASVIAHWGSAWAMILALYFGLSAVYGNGPRQETFAAHAYAGLTVLGLVVIRLFLRTLLPWPKEESGRSRILILVAEAMHWTLYALMLLTPLTGWIVASSMGCCMAVPRAVEYRSSRLRPFHRPSDQRDGGLPRSCPSCLDASCADFSPRAGGAFPPFCLSGHDPDQNDSSPWKTCRIGIGFTRDRVFTTRPAE
jgi:hypothetical protein